MKDCFGLSWSGSLTYDHGYFLNVDGSGAFET